MYWYQREESLQDKIYGVDDEIIGENLNDSYGDEKIVNMLTTTIVPVPGAGYSLLRIWGKDEGYDEPTLDETPIIAFRVFDEYGFPIPIVVEDINSGVGLDGLAAGVVTAAEVGVAVEPGKENALADHGGGSGEGAS